jgi:hypothetical protein
MIRGMLTTKRLVAVAVSRLVLLLFDFVGWVLLTDLEWTTIISQGSSEIVGSKQMQAQ